MPSITIADLNNAKLDVDHIAAFATSTAPTATDRLGNVKETLAGVRASITDAGVLGKDTLANLNADLAHQADAIAWVLNDPTPANNTQYRKLGAFGAGSWVAASTSPVSVLRADMENLARAGDIYLLSDVTGTNAITGTAASLGNLVHGSRVLLSPANDTTGATITMAVNGGAAFNVYDGYGGPIGAGGMLAGRYYELMFEQPGNVWRILSYGGDHNYLHSLYSGLPTVSGTANAIIVTGGKYPAHGMVMTFVPTATNTGPVTINALGSGDYSVFKGANSALISGDLVANFPVIVVFDGPSSKWKLISNGVLPADAVAIAAQDKAAPLKPYIVTNPYGSVSFSGGVRTIYPNRIVITGIGSSVGTGAGATAAQAPSQMLVDRLTAEMSGYGNFTFVNDNQSIGGQTLNQMLAQFNASAEGTKHVVTITPGMNDFFPANYNSGQGFAAQPDLLLSIIAAIKAAGAIPLLFTSPHPHPDRYTIGSLGENPMNYPFLTFSVTLPYAFNAAAQTISFAGAFANAGWGGPIIKVGDTVKTYSGANAGMHTVTAISGDRSSLTVNGTIVSTVTESVLLRHINVDAETVLVPPASLSKVTRDWTGGGISVAGDVRFWHGNNMLREVGKRAGAVIGDAELSFFKGVETYGYDALYDLGNYNHPSVLGYQVSYEDVTKVFARDLARQMMSTDWRLGR